MTGGTSLTLCPIARLLGTAQQRHKRMQRKDSMDALGASALITMSAILGLNQVMIKMTNVGLQPVFTSGLRSLGAVVLLYLWMRFRKSGPHFTREALPMGLVCGTLFALEFVLLFVALDYTSVAHSALMLYSMPFWLSLFAHFLIPEERITGRKSAGLVLAFTGVAIALLSQSSEETSLLGDLMALLAAIFWALIALIARKTAFSKVEPTMQIYWQVTVSAVILLALSPLFGPFIREFQLWHLAGLAYQTVIVVTMTFLIWFWLLKIYPATGVASFGFLSPLFGVLFGWLILGEEIGLNLAIALLLVCVGLILINRPARGPQVPQKV